jgi:L-ascorbate metabolism protein UlaG (beta-lactamase superfamily)
MRRKHLAISVVASCLAFAVVLSAGQPSNQAVTLRWLGHACFVLQAPKVTIVFDPFPSDQVGYKPVTVRADVVLISHHHFDHDFVKGVEGKPKVIDTPSEHKIGAVRIVAFKTSHGNGRGSNTVFIVEVAGLRIAHCGDLGVLPSDDEVKRWGRVDVLLVPVGGFYTIDADQAWQLVQRLKPAVVIPMHYGHPQSKIRELAPLDNFLKGKRTVRRLRGNSVSLDKKALPKGTEIWVLQAP